MELLIDNRQSKVEISHEVIEIIERVCEISLIQEGRDLNYEISVSFVDDSEIQRLNEQYRGIDKSTDVLSFPMYEEDFLEDGDMVKMLGDIVISTETAINQSQEYGHSYVREIAYLTAHSMFHLMGYNHLNNDDQVLMRQKEKSVMKELGVFKNKK